MTRRLFRPGGDWAALRAGFSWDIPEFFNLAQACARDWAATGRVALTHVDEAGARDWTFAELDAASDGYAAALAARGVGAGDRVAALLPQGPDVLISHLAAWKLSAIALPLFTLFGPDALLYRLRDAGAKVILTDAENLPKIEAIRKGLPDLAQTVVTGDAFFTDALASGARVEIARTRAEDPAVMIYTSGTTGPPKGVLHAHRFLFGHLPSMELTHGFFPQDGAVGWTPADWAWIGGFMDMCMPCLYYGARQVSEAKRKFDANAAFGLIAAQEVTAAFIPPTALKMMMRAPVPKGLQLRTVTSGGESLAPVLYDWVREGLGAELSEIYGQTECNLSVACVPGLMAAPQGAMGQAVPGFEICVLAPDGAEARPGEIGEIAVRRGTPVMFLKYWGQPAKTAEKFAGDWLKTGDLGSRDAEGYFTYHARDDDVINSAGYRIGPTEIENCLTGDSDVVMAAVVGVPDPKRGEMVKAFVVLAEGAETRGVEERLTQRVRERLSPHLVPRVVERVESLPMTATGKIMRRELRG